MRASGAAVVKIAAKVGRLSDCVALLDLSRTFGQNERAVLIGMGEIGLATRVLAQRFGSAWTYAGEVQDIGQVSARKLLDQFRLLDQIGAGTAVLWPGRVADCALAFSGDAQRGVHGSRHRRRLPAAACRGS